MVLWVNAQVRQTFTPTVFRGCTGFFKCPEPTASVADFGDASTQARGVTATNNFAYILADEIVNKLFWKVMYSLKQVYAVKGKSKSLLQISGAWTILSLNENAIDFL